MIRLAFCSNGLAPTTLLPLASPSLFAYLGSVLQLPSFSTQSTPAKPFQLNESEWVFTPRVSIGTVGEALGENGETTAFKFLKHRLQPRLSIGALNALFNKGLVRIQLPDGHVKRINRNKPLADGSRLLVPHHSVASVQERARRREEAVLSGALAPDRLVSAFRDQWVCYEDDDVIIVNKPRGLAVQRGKGVHVSLDDIALRAVAMKQPGVRPRLIHRLDRDVTGCVVLAKSQTAASQLIGALRERTRAVVEGVEPPQQSYVQDLDIQQLIAPKKPGPAPAPSLLHDPAVSVKKVYAAVLRPAEGAAAYELSPARLAYGRDHFLDLPVAQLFQFSDQEAYEEILRTGGSTLLKVAAAGANRQRGAAASALSQGQRAGDGAGAGGQGSDPQHSLPELKTALTRVRLVARLSAEGGAAAGPESLLVLLETPTGRKHQLRIAAAYGLGAPILGETRYPIAVRSAHRRQRGLGGGEAEADSEEESEEEEDEGTDESSGPEGLGGRRGASKPPLLLHAFGVRVEAASGRAIEAFAPLPQEFLVALAGRPYGTGPVGGGSGQKVPSSAEELERLLADQAKAFLEESGGAAGKPSGGG